MSGIQFRRALFERLGAAGCSATPAQVEALERYYELLRHWNRRLNLTSLPLDDYPGPTLDRLVVEPIVAVKLLGVEPGTWFDFGSGGGSPGIPLRIARPNLDLTMVETRERKSAFLRETVRQLQFERVRVLTARVEELSPHERGTADLVTVRGLKLDQSVISAIQSTLKKGGLLLMLGSKPLSPLPGFSLIREAFLPGESVAALLASL